MRHDDERNDGRAFAMGVVLTLGCVAAACLHGQLAHLFALVTDAGPRPREVWALAWGAAVLAQRRPTPL